MSNRLPVDVASFVAKLEQAYPEYRIAAALLARRAPALLAFEAIVHELVQAAFHLPEASVATGKLEWWRDEFARWATGQARHPLTGLIAPTSADRSSTGLEALIAIAASGRDQPPARDFAAQRAMLIPAFGAIEQLRVAMLGVPAEGSAVRAELGVASHLLRELARLPLADGSPGTPAVPMQLLARHRVSRSDLIHPGATRDAVVRAQLGDLAAALDAMRPALLDATASGFARVRWRCERWRMATKGAGDPFPQLWSRLGRAPWDAAWMAWRELRGEAPPTPAKLLSPDR